MKLYVGNTVTTVTTLMLLILLGFIGYSFFHRDMIVRWGRRSAVLLIYGLVICCFAAARDGLDKTIQNAIDGSCAPGLFSLVSVPTIYIRAYCQLTTLLSRRCRDIFPCTGTILVYTIYRSVLREKLLFCNEPVGGGLCQE